MALNINGTTGISGVDGSNSSPAIQGTDSNTGLSFASDTVKINTGGTERSRFDSNGNLLIGNTSFNNGAFGGTAKGINIAGTQPLILLHETDTDKDGYFGLAGSILRIQTADSIPVTIWTNDTKRINVHETTGDTTLETGNLVIGTAGKGIDFSAQTASSVTGATTGAEVLDSYEEGTWTPITSIGAMHTMHGAHYTKIGRLVNCQCYVTMPTSSASTHVKIDNLPFTSLGSNHYGIGAAYCQWQGNDHFFFQMSPSANHGYPHVGLGNAVTHATASGGYYLMSVTYFTA